MHLYYNQGYEVGGRSLVEVDRPRWSCVLVVVVLGVLLIYKYCAGSSVCVYTIGF